ncbi:MAG: M4 family metallopeptidase [Thermomonas sp.]
MKVQICLLSLAVASGLAMSSPAEAAGNQRSAAITRANAMINGTAANAVRRANADAFTASDAMVDADGTEHVRFQRTYRGLPVIGGDFVLHSRNGQVSNVSQTLKTAARPATMPRINSDQAIVEAGAHFGSRFIGAPASRLVIYARGASPVLAHEVTLNGIKADQTPTEMHYFVDARSGKILEQWDGIETARPGPGGGTCTASAAVGSGHSLTLGDVVLNTASCGGQFELTDLTRGGGKTTNMAFRTSGLGSDYIDADNVWGDGTLSNSQTVAADAHFGVAMTFDYFKAVHGRNGIANDGNGALSRVHYGRNYQNAFWSDGCFCMTFGDGDNGASILPLVALDVAGHEMSHGVMSRTANLVYSGESGGLNEANSDIFGTMVEYRTNDANDTPDYVIGEQLFPNNANMSQAIRWMFRPSLDRASPNCYVPTIGTLDVHYSSGVANHFYYLLAEGAVVPAGFGAGSWANLTPASLVCNGNTAITGIGRAKAEKIWYRALTVYFTSGTNYAAARVATIRAANDLYGAADANAVAAAWTAVSVN